LEANLRNPKNSGKIKKIT